MIFDPESYWQSRLSSNFNFQGVGDIRFTQSYNQSLYRLRAVAFQRALLSIAKLSSAARILDIGSGTGFYIDLWLKAGLTDVTGSDLTSAAVAKLAELYPKQDFIKWDVGSSIPDKTVVDCDAISAFDVFFHIVDDERYKHALGNVATLLKPGGYFFYSDNLMQASERRMEHVVFRERNWIMAQAAACGLELCFNAPVFFLMNAPVVSKSRVLWTLHNMIAKFASSGARSASLVGRCMYPIDRIVTRLSRFTPGTAIMVFQKKQPAKEAKES